MSDEQNLQPINTDSELAQAKKQCDEYLAGWKRARADYENLLKETARERERLGGIMTEAAVASFLPVFDHLKKAIVHVPSPLPSPPEINSGQAAGRGIHSLTPTPSFEGEGSYLTQWIDGIRHIKAELEDVLRQFGVSEIVAVGQKFDPALHESMGTETDQEQDDGVVLREIEGGYTMGGRVVRPARVIVNKRE